MSNNLKYNFLKPKLPMITENHVQYPVLKALSSSDTKACSSDRVVWFCQQTSLQESGSDENRIKAIAIKPTRFYACALRAILILLFKHNCLMCHLFVLYDSLLYFFCILNHIQISLFVSPLQEREHKAWKGSRLRKGFLLLPPI
jgi:hypothetical protein